jgi:ribosomal protein L18E
MVGNVTSSGVTLIVGQIALSLLSLGLLVFTTILSYFSYSAQARTGVRESLEQLDDVEINSSYKLKPILHRFEFGPKNPKSVLLIKIYKTQYNEASASVPKAASDQLNEDQIESITDKLYKDDEFHALLQDSGVNGDGIFFELATRNAVTARRFANSAMTEIRDAWLN